MQLTRKEEIDPMLPIYRGVHICEEAFVHHFKREFERDANSFGKEKGKLFGNQYLYPQSLIIPDEEQGENIEKFFGIYSLPRAYTLLKMFYLSIVEPVSRNPNPCTFIKDNRTSLASYLDRRNHLYAKSTERGGFGVSRKDRLNVEKYYQFIDYFTDTEPYTWPLQIELFLRIYPNLAWGIRD